MRQHSPSHNVIAQINVKLPGVTKPPVWRRLQLRADTRLDHLHEIIQAALGWENYHSDFDPAAVTTENLDSELALAGANR